MGSSLSSGKLDFEFAFSARRAEFEQAHKQKMELLTEAQAVWRTIAQSDSDWLSLPQNLFTYAQTDFLRYYVDFGREKAIHHFLPGLKQHYLEVASKSQSRGAVND